MKPRTSQSHPLQIAEVQFASGYGNIGITFCPGKKQRGALSGEWDRDLALDMASIAAWNAAAVVTLIEPHEFEMLAVENLGEAVHAHHMAWYPLPIRDVSTPDAHFEQGWEIAGAELRAILRGGGNVLVHCKGGLGRAGMTAARLLIELGMGPAAAVEAVRAVRPGAIETLAQLGYVMTLKAIPEPEPDVSGEACRDRAVGAMLGLAIGEAIGTTLEFVRRDEQPRLTDMVGRGPFNLQPGQWTDDTAMAVALMDSLLADSQLDECDLMERFLSWYENGTYSCTGCCFDIGITTRGALQRFKASGDPFAGSADPRSAGNGSLMRLAPVAIRHWKTPELLRDVAQRQSRTTHAADEAVDACAAFAGILSNAIAGKPRGSVTDLSHLPASPAILRILAGSWRGTARGSIASSGYVVHSFEAALWCLGRTGTFVDAVLLAANLGDDADTTAAITGQLAGAIYGASGIPQQWRDQLAWSERIITSAQQLFAESLS